MADRHLYLKRPVLFMHQQYGTAVLPAGRVTAPAWVVETLRYADGVRAGDVVDHTPKQAPIIVEKSVKLPAAKRK